MKSLSVKEGSKTSLESFVVHFNNIKLSATSHMSAFTLVWHHMCRKHAQFFTSRPFKLNLWSLPKIFNLKVAVVLKTVRDDTCSIIGVGRYNSITLWGGGGLKHAFSRSRARLMCHTSAAAAADADVSELTDYQRTFNANWFSTIKSYISKVTKSALCTRQDRNIPRIRVICSAAQ